MKRIYTSLLAVLMAVLALPISAATITYDFVAAHETYGDVTITSSGTSAGKNGMNTELAYPKELQDLFNGNFGFFFRNECTVKLTSEGLVMSGSRDTYISILNLKADDEVTVNFTGSILFCDNPVTNIEGITSQWTACESGTTYTITADGNFNVQWKKSKTTITSITVESSAPETVSTPGITVTGVDGVNRVVTITPGVGSFGSSCNTYYTLDGTDPTTESDSYTGPITLSETKTVKAISTLANGTTSAIASLEVVAGESIKLNATATLTDITAEGNIYKFNVSNTNLIGNPEITYSYTFGDNQGTGDTYTTTGTGKLSIIASAQGYESSDALVVEVFEYEAGEGLSLKDANILAEDDAAWTYNAEGTRYANWSGYNGVSKANYPYWTPTTEGKGKIGNITFVPNDNVLMRTIGFIHNSGSQNLSVTDLPENTTVKFVVSTYLANPFNVFVDAIDGIATYSIGAGNTGLAVESIQLFTKKKPTFDPTTLIANANFEADKPIASKICTYAKDVQEGQVANMQPLTGWTIVENGDARAAGTFAYGSNAILGGDGGTVPAVGPNGETEGKALGIEAVWNATTQYTQEITLPAGEYMMEAVIYNAAGTGALSANYIGIDGVYSTVKNYPVGKWTKDQIKFTLDEEKTVTISLGVNSGNVGNGSAPHLFIDHIKLYSSEEIAAQELAAAIEDYNIALDAANEAAADEAVTGVEKTALNEAIAANSNIDFTSLAAVKAATDALNLAVATFNEARAHYVAFANSKALVELTKWIYADAEKKTAVELAMRAVAGSADEAKTMNTALLQAYRAYIESNANAEGVEGAEVIADKIVNADASDGNNGWTISGKMNAPTNKESWTDANGKNDYMYFDGGNWNANSWDVNFAQDITLEAGKYVLSAIMRASTNVDLKLFAGTDSVKAEVIGAAGNVFDRGWNYSFVTFDVAAEGTVNIGARGITNNSHEWMSFADFRLVRIEKPAAPEFEPSYGTLWNDQEGEVQDSEDGQSKFITLENKFFKDFVKEGDTLRVTASSVGNNVQTSARRVITNGTIWLNQSERIPVESVEAPVDFVFDADLIAYVQDNEDNNLYLSFKNMTVAQVDLVEKKAEIDPTLLAEAEGLASDASAVAVGKLLAAIEAYKKDGIAETLQAAMNQFKADNADQEADQTAKVATNGWKKYDGSNAGVCATQYAPAIDTYDGRKNVQLAEVYEGTVETTGTIIYQDITGLTNGKYKVGFYGNAFFTSGRGFDSPMADGAEDVAYVFANDQKAFITAHIATSTTENDFRQFDVEVTDGTIKLGMGKEKAGTNWHTMQIYQLTWFTTAKEVYAALKTDMQALIADAKAMTGVKEKEAFETALNKAEAALESNMLNITEFEAEITALKEAMKAFKLANLVIPEGKYYLSAIELEDNNIMAAGNAWGTHGIVNGEGLDLNFIYNYDADNYNIETNIYNGDNHYLGSNLYMDAPAFGWKIEEATTGIGFNIYAMFDGVKKYISVASDGNLTLSETAYAWGFIHESNWVAIMEAVLKEALEKATPENPVDATLLLKDANFNRNDHRWEAWTVSEDCTNKNLGGGCSGTNGNGCAESYHSTFTISQTINDAPTGTYQLKVQGFYRQDGEEAEEAPVFFINNETVEVPVKTGEENDMSAASESFTAGQYYCKPEKGVYVNNGILTVGVRGTGVNQWVVFDNFRLTYYGSDNTVGITEVNTNVENNVKSIYNLNGQKVEKAKKGLYIINGKKVVIK
jgi:hypothetical protein